MILNGKIPVMMTLLIFFLSFVGNFAQATESPVARTLKNAILTVKENITPGLSSDEYSNKIDMTYRSGATKLFDFDSFTHCNLQGSFPDEMKLIPAKTQFVMKIQSSDDNYTSWDLVLISDKTGETRPYIYLTLSCSGGKKTPILRLANVYHAIGKKLEISYQNNFSEYLLPLINKSEDALIAKEKSSLRAASEKEYPWAAERCPGFGHACLEKLKDDLVKNFLYELNSLPYPVLQSPRFKTPITSLDQDLHAVIVFHSLDVSALLRGAHLDQLPVDEQAQIYSALLVLYSNDGFYVAAKDRNAYDTREIEEFQHAVRDALDHRSNRDTYYYNPDVGAIYETVSYMLRHAENLTPGFFDRYVSAGARGEGRWKQERARLVLIDQILKAQRH